MTDEDKAVLTFRATHANSYTAVAAQDEIARLECELEGARKLIRDWEDLSARRAKLLHRDTPKNRLVVEIRELRTENARLLADLTLERAKANGSAAIDPDELARIAESLPTRDFMVLDLCYGIQGRDRHSGDEVARILRVTRERARQMRYGALKSLGIVAKAEGIPPDDLGEILAAAGIRRRAGIATSPAPPPGDDDTADYPA